MTWQEVAQKYGNAHPLDSTHKALAEEILRLVAENEKMKEAWMSDQTNITKQLAHSERRREKLREALQKISGTDEIFEKTEFDPCDCEESNAYLQMNKRRKRTAREALDADAAENA